MLEQLKQMTPQQRADFLKSNADSTVEGEYFQQFGIEEVQQTQADLSDVAMKIESLQDEKKALTEDLNAKIKAHKKDYKAALVNLKQNGELLKGTIYEFRDQERKMVDCYDITGHLVQSRRMRPEERQMTVLNFKAS